jgi:hypothetical protein
MAVTMTVVRAPYPSRTIQCWSSLTKPTQNLICPDARNNYCVKQTSNLKKDLCGKTQYFGDQWDAANGLCYYKKCGYACKQGATKFHFGGVEYTRNEYCCKDKNFCNAASRQRAAPLVHMVLACAVAVAAVYFFA